MRIIGSSQPPRDAVSSLPGEDNPSQEYEDTLQAIQYNEQVRCIWIGIVNVEQERCPGEA